MDNQQNKLSDIAYPIVDMLQSALELCVLKAKDINRISSIAISKSGKHYIAGRIASDTKLLDISSEQAVLTLSAQSNDFEVYKIVTLMENPDKKSAVSPAVIKILIDHSIRTGIPIEYKIINLKNETISHFENITNVFSFYNPSPVKLVKVEANMPVSENKIILQSKSIDEYPLLLKQYAIQGIERNFPTYDSASGYGAAIVAKNNTLYFGGQYSGFDNNAGLHAEMAVILRALMDRNSDITHLGVVSTKYPDVPCTMCGCCRQFVSEISTRFNLDIGIFYYAKDNNVYTFQKIKDYLPGAWTSKKW